MFRTVLLTVACVVTLMTVANASADCGSCESCATHKHVTPNTMALGLGGYSPVSYFAEGGPRYGSPQFQATHEGVTYFFADAKEQAAFTNEPARYAPAYGGWCAYGMAVEGQFPADPTNYKIVDGRLMVFLKNAEVDTRQVWNEGRQTELVGKADAFYAKLAE